MTSSENRCLGRMIFLMFGMCFFSFINLEPSGTCLGGGMIPYTGGMIQFDEHIFQISWKHPTSCECLPFPDLSIFKTKLVRSHVFLEKQKNKTKRPKQLFQKTKGGWKMPRWCARTFDRMHTLNVLAFVVITKIRFWYCLKMLKLQQLVISFRNCVESRGSMVFSFSIPLPKNWTIDTDCSWEEFLDDPGWLNPSQASGLIVTGGQLLHI